MENKKQNKNIVHIVHVHGRFYPYMGGSTFRLLNLLNGINKQNSNFYFTVLCEKHAKNLPYNEILSPNIEIIRFKNYFNIPSILFKISKQKKIHIIHAHNYRPLLFASFFNFFSKIPIIAEMHAVYKTSPLKQIIGNILLKRANVVIVLSNKSREYLSKEYKIRKNKIRIVYNGIDINLFNKHKIKLEKMINYKKMFNFLSKFRLKVAYIGSLHEWQGVHNFIKIVKKISLKNKDIGFLIVGDGPEYSKIKKDIENYSLYNKVFIRHAIPHNDIPSIYKKIDILLMPRISTLATETAIPLKPLEALASGKTVVGTNVGGLIDLQKYFPKNIFLFNSIQKISSFIKNVKKNKLKKEIPREISFFSDSLQAKRLIKIYNTIQINN